MSTMQKIISVGFATAALASASMPAMSWTVWPDVDFEWYANVGKPVNTGVVEAAPAPRAGYIWSPGHVENTASGRQTWVAGHWIVDDYNQQVATYSAGSTVATGPTTLRDRDGNGIPTDPNAYPIDSNRR